MKAKIFLSIAPMVSALFAGTSAQAASFTQGDIFASGGGVLKVYSPSGSLI